MVVLVGGRLRVAVDGSSGEDGGGACDVRLVGRISVAVDVWLGGEDGAGACDGRLVGRISVVVDVYVGGEDDEDACNG